MEETATYGGNSNLNRMPSAGLSRAQDKSASKALMGLRHLKADDIGVLRYTRSSELGTQVKCTNHAHDVTVRKQVNTWHRDQRIAVSKLARGQQKMFRNLIRVQNDKRRIQRQARNRKQREVQIELRERAVRERGEAQTRLRDMIMTDDEALQIEEEVTSGIGEAPRILPEINESDVEIDLKDTRDVGNGETGSSPLKNSRKSIRSSYSGQESPLKRQSRNSSKRPPLSSSAHLPSHKSPCSEQANQNANMSQVLEAVTQANLPLVQPERERSLLKDNGTGLITNTRPHFSREAKQPIESHTTSSTSGTNDSDMPAHRSEEHEDVPNINPNKVLHGIGLLKTSKDYSLSQKYKDGASFENNKFQDSVFEGGDRTLLLPKAKDQTTQEKERRKQSERGPRNKYHIGIANRTFRVPDYQAPVVTSVVRYQRNSEGSLVPSEVAVKPASEEYKLPSRRAEYMVEKALEWEKRREDVRQQKLHGFLERMKEIERQEKMESRLTIGLDYARHKPFHYHHLTHPKDLSNLAASIQQTTQRSGGKPLEPYHLKGDVQDMKNCRYLRLNDKAGPGEVGEGEKRGQRGVLGMPHGHGVPTGRQQGNRAGLLGFK